MMAQTSAYPFASHVLTATNIRHTWRDLMAVIASYHLPTLNHELVAACVHRWPEGQGILLRVGVNVGVNVPSYDDVREGKHSGE